MMINWLQSLEIEATGFFTYSTIHLKTKELHTHLILLPFQTLFDS